MTTVEMTTMDVMTTAEMTTEAEMTTPLIVETCNDNSGTSFMLMFLETMPTNASMQLLVTNPSHDTVAMVTLRSPLIDDATFDVQPRDSLVINAPRELRAMGNVISTSGFMLTSSIDVTVHGFRSSFRDWAGETTAFPREVIEAALAHQLKDKAEAAYARGDLFDKRRELMRVWAGFLQAS